MRRNHGPICHRSYDEATGQGDAQEQFKDDSGEKVFFDYTASAYKKFLEGQDDYAVLDKDLADNFGSRPRSRPRACSLSLARELF